MTSAVRSAVLWLTVLLLSSSGAWSGERTHRVSGGESASTIANQHYGKHELGRLLLLYNEKPNTVIHVGETLRVPYCEVHRIASGDSWSKLAQRYLGNAKQYPAIAALNGLDPDRPLQVGVEILIPVVLSHRLARGETLDELARTFYGEESMRDVLRSFNGIDDPRRLSVGQRIGVPLVTLRLRNDLQAKLPAPTPPRPAVEERPSTPAKREEPVTEVADRADPEPEPLAATLQETADTAASPAPESPREPEEAPARFVEELTAASEAFAEGEYAAARQVLESLIEPVSEQGSATEKADLGRLLAFTYVAFDLHDEACAVYGSIGGSAIEQSPLDDRVSPKIRRTLSACD